MYKRVCVSKVVSDNGCVGQRAWGVVDMVPTSRSSGRSVVIVVVYPFPSCPSREDETASGTRARGSARTTCG